MVMLLLPYYPPLRHIDMLEGLPVIGDTYLVRCVQTTANSLYDERWWPVTTVRPHNDHEYKVGPDVMHHHFDVRFLTDEMIDIIFRDRVLPKRMRPAAVLDRIITKNQYVGDGKTQYKPMACVRETPVWPLRIAVFSKSHRVGGETQLRIMYDDNEVYDTVIGRLEPVVKDKKVKMNTACKRCPHRGVSLAGIAPQEDGTIVCPGHGLRFDCKTGAMVSRKPELEALKEQALPFIEYWDRAGETRKVIGSTAPYKASNSPETA